MARRSVIPRDRFPRASKVTPPQVEEAVHPLDEEDELPRVCLYETGYKKVGEDLWSSDGRKVKDNHEVPNAKGFWLTLEKLTRDPRTNTITPKEFTHYLTFPFRSDKNLFINDGFLSQDVIAGIRASVALEQGLILEKIIPEETLIEEKKNRKSRNAAFVPPPSEAPLSPRTWGEEMPMPTGSLAGAV